MTDARTVAASDALAAIEGTPFDRTVPRLPLHGHVRHWAQVRPDADAIVYLPQGRVSDVPQVLDFRSLWGRIRAQAGWMLARGIGPSDCVALLLPNVPEMFVGLFAVPAVARAMPLNTGLTAEAIAALLLRARARAVVTLSPRADPALAAKAREACGRLQQPPELWWVGEPPAGDWGGRPLDASACEPADGDPGLGEDPEACALYIGTGGTTGRPKIAMVSHAAIAYKAWAYRMLLGYRPGDRGTIGLPQFHIGGIVANTVAFLASGMACVVLGPLGFRNREALAGYWRLVERHRITDLGGVPTSLSALAEVPRDADTSTLRAHSMSGSSGMPASVRDFYRRELGIRLLNGYGLTEYTATVALPVPEDCPEGAAGLRLPYTEVRIVRGDGATPVRCCGPDEVGEIEVRGPGVFLGYVGSDSSPVRDDGWLRTGDLGRLDDRGYLWVTGRLKDVIVRSGHNIDPGAVEQALQSHPAVALAAAVGQCDAYAGEVPVAFVQLRPGCEVDPSAVLEHARARIADPAAVPKAVWIRDALPLTPVGKVYKPELRRQAAAAALGAALDRGEARATSIDVSIRDDGALSVAVRAPDAEAAARAASVLARFTIESSVACGSAGSPGPSDEEETR